MNPFDQITAAISEAETTQRAADRNADKMARMIAWRLRVAGVNASTLIALKRELRRFNMHTGCWLDE